MSICRQITSAELTVAIWEAAERCNVAGEPLPQLNPTLALLGGFDLVAGVLRPVGAAQQPLGQLLALTAAEDVEARLVAWERFPIRGAIGVDRAGRCVLAIGSMTTRPHHGAISDRDAALLEAWARHSLGLEIGVPARSPSEIYGSMWCSTLVLLGAAGRLDVPFAPHIDGTGPPLSPTVGDLASWPDFQRWLGHQQVPPVLVDAALHTLPPPLWSWLLAAVMPPPEQCELLLQCVFGDRYTDTWLSLRSQGLVPPAS